MAAWIYDWSGRPQIIVDGDRFLDRNGVNTVGWIDGTGTFTFDGQHAGWYEDGILRDTKNQCVGFAEEATGEMPSRPELTESRSMPDLGKSRDRSVAAGVLDRLHVPLGARQ